MAYLSLYRKWRPQTFADVVGQTHVVRTLENSLKNDRISHAYLFTGPRGTGKTTVARLLAKGLNCQSGPTPVPCGECHECQHIASGVSLNVIEIDGASNRGIEEIRELREQVRYAPTSASFRVYIIDEIHMLTPEAFNALLKTLEEPPPHVIFVFATTDPHKIPATILSRCQRFDFRRLADAELVARLRYVLQEEHYEGQQQALELVAEHAEGGMRDALGILDQCMAYGEELTVDVVSEVLGVVEHTRMEGFAKAIHDKEVRAALLLIHDVHQEGKDLTQFARDVVQFFRRMLLDETVADLGWTRTDLLRAVDVFARVERDMRQTKDVNIPLELAVLELTEMEADEGKLAKRIVQLEERIASLQQGGVSPPHEHGDRSVATTKAIVGDDQERLRKIVNNWQDYLMALRNERLVQPEAFLREGTPIALKGDQLTVAFPKERGFHKASIEQEKHQEPAERVLSKFYGAELRLQCVIQEPQRSSEHQPSPSQTTDNKTTDEGEQAGMDEVVSAALKIFGGKIVEVKDREDGV